MSREFIVYKYEITLAKPVASSIEDEIDVTGDLQEQLKGTLHAIAMDYPFRHFPTVELKVTECEDLPELVGMKVSL